MRKVVVTGGAGFIGSHLSERLLAEGNEVHVLDDESTGTLRNLEAQRSHPNLHVDRVDIADRARLDPLFEGADWVFHLAALADIVPSIERPLDYAHANVTGTFAVLDAAVRAGVRRFVYAASSSCYGIPAHYPTPESEACQPRYPYALTKYLGEQTVLHWCQVYGLPAVSLRLFNVYGPRARTSGTYGAVFGVFLAQRLAGAPLTIVGDGSQTRDFVYVTDVVDAFVRAAKSDVCGAFFNVGTGRPVAVRRIAELIGGDAVHIPKRPGEPDATHADITAIQQRLGWQPSIDIAEGVARMLERIDDWRHAPVWTPERISSATQTWFRHLGRGDAA